MKTRSVYYVLGVVISLLVLTSVVGLGAYAYHSNNTLLATQEQLHGLQKAYDQLKTDHTTLNNEYAQTKTDLEAANGRIASLEGELKMAKEQNQKLAQTLQIARLNMDVLDGLFDNSLSLQDMEARIAATGNSEMSAKWSAINDQDGLGNFIVYLVHFVRQSLN